MKLELRNQDIPNSIQSPSYSTLSRFAGVVLMLLSGTASAGGLGLDVDLDVGHGGIDLDVGVGAAGLDVDAGVGVGGSGVDVAVGVGGGTGGAAGPGGPSGSGGPGVPGVVNPTQPSVATVAGAGKKLACAKDGNATAYNGFVVRDRSGTAIGVVHDATVNADQKLVTVRMQSSGTSCFPLSGGSFKFRDGEIWTNADASSFR